LFFCLHFWESNKIISHDGGGGGFQDGGSGFQFMKEIESV
jgi:hypothetical protein